MLISKLGCPEDKENNSITSIFVTSWSSKPLPVAFWFPIFLADLDEKYGNEIEMNKN